MKLSVVIVNYNVKHFLEQCLLSVERASAALKVEVWVVDNLSVDGSVAMVRQKFPWVHLIANDKNLGFSKANNQAMRLATGEYVLLLNPDTVIEEDTLMKVAKFMDDHPDAGGLGVKMVDGKGTYLPESKRGLPSPETAFYKIFGIARLFPKSKRFNRYYLGDLDKEETHEIEILSGAFMLMRKTVLDKVGLLDEAFFMYGEDIDLSWRIIQGGYKNYYFPQTTIIHYKGESTKKGSLNYVFVFYNAMIIFATKHFSPKRAKLYSGIIKMAVYLRAAVAIVHRFVKKITPPVLDFSLSLGGLWILKNVYSGLTEIPYDAALAVKIFTGFILTWMLVVHLSGGNDSPVKIRNLIRGYTLSMAVTLIAYSLLPENLRFSRAILLMGGVVAALVFSFNRWLLHQSGFTGFVFESRKNKRYLVVSEDQEFERISELIRQTTGNPQSITQVPFSGKDSLENLEDFIRVHKADEVVYSAADVPSGAIIGSMSRVRDKRPDFKIAPPETLYMIGSNSIHSPGDLLMLNINSIDKPGNKRAKRIFDLVASLLILLAAPLLPVFRKKPCKLLKNTVLVILGQKTWVGFSGSLSIGELPDLKPGVFSLDSALPNADHDPNLRPKLNSLYAKDYKWQKDLAVLWKSSFSSQIK